MELEDSDPEMRLEDGIVIFGGDVLAGSKGLIEPASLQREGFLDTELAGQDVAMESKSTGVGSALFGAGHGEFSVVTFREIATNKHCVHLNFRAAAANSGNGGCQTYLFDS